MLKIAIFIILRHNCLNSFCLTRSFAPSKTSIICWKGFRVTKEKKKKKTKTYKLYTVTNRSLDIIFKERKYFHIFNIFLVIIIVDFQKTKSYLGSSSQVIITFYNWLTNGMITIKKKSLSQRCVTQRICLRTNNLFSILQRDWDYRSTADSSEYFNKV